MIGKCQLTITVLKQVLPRTVRPLTREREARTNGLIRTRDMEHGVTVIGNVMAAALVILSGERSARNVTSRDLATKSGNVSGSGVTFGMILISAGNYLTEWSSLKEWQIIDLSGFDADNGLSHG